MKKKILIVGTGLYGIVSAYFLSKKFDITIIDEKSFIGGACATEKIEDIIVHTFGPHIFHTNNKEIWDFINKFGEFKKFYNEPLANYNGTIYNLPFNMNTFSKLWNIRTPLEAKMQIDYEKLICDNPQNLEEFALSQVGSTIYEKLIKHYTEKQWGKSCTELPPSIIKRLPLRFEYNNHYFNDIYQGVPLKGYSEIFKNILKKCKNTKLQLNTKFTKDLEDEYDLVLYTGSIDEYYDYKFGTLEYRSLQFNTQLFNIENYQGNAVVNYTGTEAFTRITEHKHFTGVKSKNTIITVEYPIKWTPFYTRYYPVPTDDNLKLYEQYSNITNNKVIFGGRLGLYKYLNMDKIIELAIQQSGEILSKYE